MNLAVNKKAIINALWRGKGAETPFSYYYYPFNKGYSADWKIPPYDPERAKKLMAEAGQAGGFEIRVNPMVMVYALDGPDVMEAVALDWEKIGIKVKRVPEAITHLRPEDAGAKTNKTHWVYGSPPFGRARARVAAGDSHQGRVQPASRRRRTTRRSTPRSREFDPEQRAKLTHDLGQKLYDNYHGVMLGMKTATWATSKKVGGWETLAYTPLETNYEYLSSAG